MSQPGMIRVEFNPKKRDPPTDRIILPPKLDVRKQDEVCDLALNRRLPQAIIIGVMKGGTKALLDIVALHRDVRISPEEVNFFGKKSLSTI